MNNIGLYIHIPFCDGKCAYCSFFSKSGTTAELDRYTDELINKTTEWSKTINRTVDTVYFGGGTPSLLGHERLIKILESIKKSFSVTNDAEITLEVNPTSTPKLDFSALRRSGFNRLSIGLQSSDDRELRILGRRHSSDDAKNTVDRAKSGGFDNISLDVMLAIPEQTIETLDKTLEFCASCGVQHISSYILKVEQGTPFYNIKDKLNLFTEDEQADIYEHTVKKLNELGYYQYEISNFSKPGFESRHNLHYWHDEEYLGIGPSAHSFIGNKRFYYGNNFENFYNNEIKYEPDGGSKEEYIMLALRLSEGLIFEKYKKRYNEMISDDLIAAAKILEKNGLCKVSDKAVSLTVKGYLVSNSVIAYLTETLDNQSKTK